MTKTTPWLFPTVSDVEKVLIEIAEKYGLEDFKAVHTIVGVTDRTLRRWRSKADTEPNAKSTIPYLGSIALWSIKEDQFVNSDWQNLRNKIPPQYLMNAKNYVCPPADFLKSLVGKKNVLGWTLKELATRLRCSPEQLGADIKREKVSFLTFSAILMYCGYKPHEVFGLTPNEKENRVLLSEVINQYINDKNALHAKHQNELKDLALRYLEATPELKKAEGQGLPKQDLESYEEE